MDDFDFMFVFKFHASNVSIILFDVSVFTFSKQNDLDPKKYVTLL